MAASPIIGERLGFEFVYIVMYHLRPMSEEEEKDWMQKWAVVRTRLPTGMRIVTEASNAFGTEYTGFTVFEGPFDKFQELVEMLESESQGYLDRTEIIIGRKGILDGPADVQKILVQRPID